MQNNLKVLLVASEAAPFIKSGGLGDVIGSLPKALRAKGVDVRVVIPRYMSIKNEAMYGVEFVGEFEVHLQWRVQTAKILVKKGDVPIYFIENNNYFGRGGVYGYGDDNERFGFYSKAVLDMLAMLDFYPDIIHCNDWQTGPVCMYLKEIYSKMLSYSKIKSIFTIHNLQYQGNFEPATVDMLGVPVCYGNGNAEFYGCASYMKMGLQYADYISTVSEAYAGEIQTPEYGYGMEGILYSRRDALQGILNGIDYAMNDPATDPRIVKNFSPEYLEGKRENKKALQEWLRLEPRDVPVIAMITRLADQKGFDILTQVLDEMMRRDIQFVLLGTGEGRLEHIFQNMAQAYQGRISANIFFDEALAQQIYASADMFLMPSRFEPCGLGQMFSLRYGTVPIVRKTGGLADTITHYNPETKEGNGFLFETYDGGGLLWAVDQALHTYHMGWDEWAHVVRNAMNCDYSWESSAEKYIALYNKLKYSDRIEGSK